MDIEPYELRRLLTDAMEISRKDTLSELGVIKPWISKSEAFRIYGRSIVERWIKERLIKINKDGEGTAKNRLNRTELEILAKTSNRSTYLTKKERR